MLRIGIRNCQTHTHTQSVTHRNISRAHAVNNSYPKLFLFKNGKRTFMPFVLI